VRIKSPFGENHPGFLVSKFLPALKARPLLRIRYGLIHPITARKEKRLPLARFNGLVGR
jgi:hypothetical protein